MQISKFNASGNDFAIFTAFKRANRSEFARLICDRFNGVGADGLIVILPSVEADFEWEFYNNDGSEAKMCGNGSRAAAFYAHKNGLCAQKCNFLTGAGIINANVEISGDFSQKFLSQNCKKAIVEVALTKPKKLGENFKENGFLWHFYDTGVPHLVTFCENLDDFNIEICQKMRQKYDTNVDFVAFEGKILKVRTFERGVENETNACGTGMAAAFFAALKSKMCGENVLVKPKSDETLFLRFDGETIHFKGSVTHCFDAVI